VARCVRGGGSLDELMNSVVAVTGDVFFIPPGLAHALGGGLLVLEPQRVRRGRRSVTYRFWDWGRRYDSDGHLSATGAPRALHLDQALTDTDWAIGGTHCLAGCRRAPAQLSIAGGFSRWRVLDEPAIYIERWVGTGEAALPDVRTLLGVFCAAGQTQIRGRGQRVEIGQGRTAVVPAGATHLIAELFSAGIYFCVARV
jgi:mannose-6-phosphate isomerase class I